MDHLLTELSDAVRRQESTFLLWNEIFSNATMRTELDEQQKKKIVKIFRQIKSSENKKMFVREFMKSVRQSILNRPKVTRHLLEQMLPPGSFPQSIHKYSNWKKIAPVLDYLRYWLFGAPTRKFQEQFSQYSIPQDSYQLKTSSALLRKPRQWQEPIETMQYLGQ